MIILTAIFFLLSVVFVGISLYQSNRGNYRDQDANWMMSFMSFLVGILLLIIKY